MPNFADGLSFGALWDAWQFASPLARDMMLLQLLLLLAGALIFVVKSWVLLWRSWTDNRFTEKFFSYPDMQQANDNLRMQPTPASRVFVAGLIERNFWKKRGGEEQPLVFNMLWQSVSHAMRFQVDVEVAEMRRGFAVLTVGSWLAPLLGLFSALGDSVTLLAAGAASLTGFGAALAAVFTGAGAALLLLLAHAILTRYLERFDERLTVGLERFVSWAYR